MPPVYWRDMTSLVSLKIKFTEKDAVTHVVHLEHQVFFVACKPPSTIVPFSLLLLGLITDCD